MIYLMLFAEFFRIGLFSVGGGLAALPFIYELAQRTRWVDAAKIPDFLAAAQVIPGAIGVNLSAYTGAEFLGVPGAYLAALGMICPSIIVITAISYFYARFKENKIAAAVFAGMRPASLGLIASACASLLAAALYVRPESLSPSTFFAGFRLPECALFAAFLVLVFALKKHPVFYITLGAIAGLVFKLR